MTAATITAQALAAYLMATVRRCSFTKLHTLLYYCNAWSLVMDGHPLFAEPIYAVWWGPSVEGITLDWYRRERLRQQREPMRLRALARRCRRWMIRQQARRGGMMGLNLPGGWSDRDARVQGAALTEAMLTPRPNRAARRVAR